MRVRRAALLVALVGLFVPHAGAAQERPPVYVELSEVSGAAGNDASPTVEAIAHILVGAGLPVSLGHARQDCGAACVHVTVRREPGDAFTIEARYLDRSTRTSLQLPASTSSFDGTHALAVQVELLVDATLNQRTPRRVATAQPASAARVPEETPLDQPQVAPPDTARDAMRASVELDGAGPPRAIQPLPVSLGITAELPRAATARPERIAFQADAITLGTASGGLITFGLALALRVPLGERYDVRLGAAVLDADRETEGEMHFWRKLNPLSLYATTVIPSLPGLRVGAGGEAVAMVGEGLAKQSEPSFAWSLGVVGHVEYRIPVRSFTARVALASAYHPFNDRLVGSDSVTLLEYPHWTMSASLGLEFRLW